MAKVPSYHTDFEEHSADHGNVYHDHDNCPDGGLLLPHHRKSGTGVSLTEGQITEVSGYLFARPTDSKPVPKNSFVTRVGDLGCGVGYYK
jgi:hypothetical protein